MKFIACLFALSLGACAMPDDTLGSAGQYQYQAGFCGGKGYAAQSGPILGGVFYTYVEGSICYSPGYEYYIPTSDAQTFPGYPMAKPFTYPIQWQVKSPIDGRYY